MARLARVLESDKNDVILVHRRKYIDGQGEGK